MRRVVVGFSGGVTSAWCAGWALRNFPRVRTPESDPECRVEPCPASLDLDAIVCDVLVKHGKGTL